MARSIKGWLMVRRAGCQCLPAKSELAVAGACQGGDADVTGTAHPLAARALASCALFVAWAYGDKTHGACLWL